MSRNVDFLLHKTAEDTVNILVISLLKLRDRLKDEDDGTYHDIDYILEDAGVEEPF